MDFVSVNGDDERGREREVTQQNLGIRDLMCMCLCVCVCVCFKILNGKEELMTDVQYIFLCKFCVRKKNMKKRCVFFRF